MAPFPSPTPTWHNNTYPALSPTRPELSAKGKTIVVTGGGTGIGAATALAFARAGASRIALLGRRLEPLQSTKTTISAQFPSVEIFTASTDITNKSQVDDAFSKFLTGGQKINVLVSNAATIGPHVLPINTVDTVPFLDSINTNISGSLYVAQAFLRHAAEDAVVIDINSSTAVLNFVVGFEAYGISKLAVYRLWDSVVFDNPGLSVFHVQPGVVATDLNAEAGGVKATGIEDDVSLPATFNVWLTSPEAKFLKGKFLFSNWDVDELKARAEEIEGSEMLGIHISGWPFGDAMAMPEWKA